MINFQSESKRAGDEFEAKVHAVLWLNPHNSITKNYEVPDTGCEVDFLFEDDKGKVYIECKGGSRGIRKRPGAERTDNVKKAIANAALIKAAIPDAYYIVYFSAPPKLDSYSDKMIKLALKHKILDEVIYL